MLSRYAAPVCIFMAIFLTTFGCELLPDTTPPVISDVTFTVADTSVVISWTTDEPATSTVRYGETTDYGESITADVPLSATHEVILTGLKEATTYHFVVVSEDEEGNEATSEDYSFVTKDLTPPSPSQISAEPTDDGAVISWTTDEPSFVQVEYGPTVSYGFSISITEAPSTSHQVVITGLEGGRTYHFRVRVRDAEGNEYVSEDMVFTTLDLIPPSISSVNVVTMGDVARISWTSDDPAAEGRIIYGISALSDSAVASAAADGGYAAEASGLAAGSEYQYRIVMVDKAGNTSTFDGSFTTVDLILSTEVNEQYMDYLANKMADYENIVDDPASDDLERAKASVGASLIRLAKLRIETLAAAGDILDMRSRVRSKIDLVVDFIEDNILPMDTGSVQGFTSAVEALFTDPKFSELKAQVESIRDILETEIPGDIASLQQGIYYLQELYESELEGIGQEIGSVYYNYPDFEFRFYIKGSGLGEMSISSNNFDKFHDIEDKFALGLGKIMTTAQSLGETYGTPGYQYTDADRFALSDGLGDIISGLEEIKSVFSMEPLRQFHVDTSPVDRLIAFVDDLRGVVEGEEIPLKWGKTIRPAAWLEDDPGDLNLLISGFYSSGDPLSYTFGGLFPQGLPEKLYNYLEADLVIDPRADRDELRSYLEGRLLDFESELSSNPDDSDANIGTALIKTYLLVDDSINDFIDMLGYLEVGNIAGIYQNYDLSEYDRGTALDSIRTHLNRARGDREAFFLMLFPEREHGRPIEFEVRPDDGELSPIFITSQELDLLEGSFRAAERISDEVGRFAEKLTSDIREVFIIDLDPNKLDFSDAENPVDVVDALLKSNPEFLNLAPGGDEKLREIGDNIRRTIDRMIEDIGYISSMADVIASKEAELGIDTSPFREMVSKASSPLDEVREDFATPSAVTMIDGNPVNLSAWFDMPPDSLLYRFRNFLLDRDDTDNTLGGLFPARVPLRTAPVLLEPADGATGVPPDVTLRWTPVPEMVDGYQIVIYGEGGVYVTDIEGPSYSIEKWGWPDLGRGKTWHWKVRAYRNAGSEELEHDPDAGMDIWRPSNPGPWSELRTFTTSF